jgi:hypothetical protein
VLSPGHHAVHQPLPTPIKGRRPSQNRRPTLAPTQGRNRRVLVQSHTLRGLARENGMTGADGHGGAVSLVHHLVGGSTEIAVVVRHVDYPYPDLCGGGDAALIGLV